MSSAARCPGSRPLLGTALIVVTTLICSERASAGTIGIPSAEVPHGRVVVGAEWSASSHTLDIPTPTDVEQTADKTLVSGHLGYGLSQRLTVLGKWGTSRPSTTGDDRGGGRMVGFGAKFTLHEAPGLAKFGVGVQVQHVAGEERDSLSIPSALRRIGWWEYDVFAGAIRVRDDGFSPYGGLHLAILDGRAGAQAIRQTGTVGFFIGVVTQAAPFGFGFEVRQFVESAVSVYLRYRFD